MVLCRSWEDASRFGDFVGGLAGALALLGVTAGLWLQVKTTSHSATTTREVLRSAQLDRRTALQAQYDVILELLGERMKELEARLGEVVVDSQAAARAYAEASAELARRRSSFEQKEIKAEREPVLFQRFSTHISEAERNVAELRWAFRRSLGVFGQHYSTVPLKEFDRSDASAEENFGALRGPVREALKVAYHTQANKCLRWALWRLQTLRHRPPDSLMDTEDHLEIGQDYESKVRGRFSELRAETIDHWLSESDAQLSVGLEKATVGEDQPGQE
ncbi:hypothetical protein ACFL59_14935 [Planctomycetota bacterium]